jgi:alkanesulfonate monooxygenase SsuD/methylene tetrahydromethanopterin reductase-like flavin-dependent oxidoreductase (luciferase family)
MDFGISFLPDATIRQKDAHTYFRDIFDIAIEADRVGLSTVKMTEHYVNAYGSYCPSPLAFLAAVAVQTCNIRLMTGCVLPIFHHPIQLASEIAMIDAISNGRLDVGFGRAHIPSEFEMFEIPFDESRIRFEYSIAAIKQLLSGESVTCQTPYFYFKDILNELQPVQRPHPPFWGAAIATPSSFKWFGENGMNLLIGFLTGPSDFLRGNIRDYKEAFKRSKIAQHASPRIAVSLPLFIAEDSDSALEEVRPYLTHYLETWGKASRPWKNTSSKDYASYTKVYEMIRTTTPEVMCASGGAMVGSPSMIIDAIGSMTTKLDVDMILWQLDFGAMSHRNMRRTLDLFVDKVLPFI